jgi:hypothetical protein
MKFHRIILAAALLAPTLAAATDVGVSVSIGQPGFYGRIDIGDVQPQLVYAQPVIIHGGSSRGRPLYLHVPPGHEKHWDKHCAQYNACGERVYFVQDNWYNNVYVPDYQRRRGDHDDDHGHDHGHDDHGNGHGNKGNGKGRGNGKD